MRLVTGAEKMGKRSIPASEGWHRLTIRKMSSADGVSCRMDTPSAYCRDFFVFLKLLLSAGRGLLIFLIPFPLADGGVSYWYFSRMARKAGRLRRIMSWETQ